ncbi:ankyrin repeat-containing domain protein [Aspergillus alliaceus]|uniref:Ankyrin repeat-containing domain protein n=1 Tax=Petromyces alliaceus TaxID=209559 RepID=A0A5N7CM67_PETAA|nr:ankyrin repeat-containing domain protein [Aspergillus alliaceus]
MGPIERRYSEGLTLLAFAARWDYVKSAEVLVSQGASANSVMHGSTTLAIAIDYDSVSMVKFLENGADLNITDIRTSGTRPLLLRAIKKPDGEEDWKGRTPLFFATVKQNLDTMRLLLGHGADPT